MTRSLSKFWLTLRYRCPCGSLLGPLALRFYLMNWRYYGDNWQCQECEDRDYYQELTAYVEGW